MRKHRKIELRVETLEGRELLSAGYQSPGTLQATTMMMPLPPMMPPPPKLGDLGVGAVGMGVQSVGGGVSILATDVSAWKIVEATWTVTGALQHQTFTASRGDYARFTGLSQYFPGGTDFGTLGVIWDENPGQKTITISVRYDDPSGTTLTAENTVTTVKPNATLKLTGAKLHMGPRAGQPPTDTWGVSTAKPDGGAGIRFDGTVTSVPTGGEFAVVQLMTAMQISSMTQTESTSIQLPSGGGPYLDVQTASSSPAIHGLWDGFSPYPPMFPMTPRFDSPAVYDGPLYLDIDPAKAKTTIVMSMEFKTQLVWHPSGGGYVSVSEITWSLLATAVYKGPMAQATFLDNYMNPSKWTFSTNHLNDWVQNGDGSTKLPKWTDYVGHAKTTITGPRM